MKKYRNFIYTASFKGILMLLIVTMAWIATERFLCLYSYSIENPVGIRNVFRQNFSFDYESSAYAEAQVEDTIDRVLEYSLEYMHSKNLEDVNSKEDYDYYLRLSNDGYRELADYLEELEHVSFAVVNHGTGKIVSDIKEIDGAASTAEIRQLFQDKGKYQIIIYNCQNPYFEPGFTEGFVEHVREQAAKYTDRFDLYLSLGNSLELTNDAAYYSKLHTRATELVCQEIINCFIFSALCVAIAIALVSVAGKAEKNGKFIPTITDDLPNDLLLILYIAIAVSVNALYHTSLYMVYKSCTIEDYGLGFSPELYEFRAKVCMSVFAMIITVFACKIKRQKKLGTLTTNTYIYRFYSVIKQKNLPQK